MKENSLSGLCHTFTQIVIIQLSFYLLSFCTLLFFTLILRVPFHLKELVTIDSLIPSTSERLACLLSLIITSGFMIVVLSLIVSRARKIMDFGLTYILLHVLFCCILQGFPKIVSWWVIQGVCATGVIILGELLSMRLEMAEINIENILTDKNPKRKMYNELQRMRKIKV